MGSQRALSMKVAIIGAGLSGSILANILSKKHTVHLFEKARGVGGRLSTRYVDAKRIDHGVAFISTQDKHFKHFLNERVIEGVLRKEGESFYPRFGMNTLCKVLLGKTKVFKNTKILRCTQEEALWYLEDEQARVYRGYEQVFVCIPSKQVLELNLPLPTKIQEALTQTVYESFATVLLYSPLQKSLKEAELLDNLGLDRVVNNSKKYFYKPFSSYVLHAKPTQNISSKEAVKSFFEEVLDKQTLENFVLSEHFWKYALVTQGMRQRCFYEQGFGLCGDYFYPYNLEGAFHSALSLAAKVE